MYMTHIYKSDLAFVIPLLANAEDLTGDVVKARIFLFSLLCLCSLYPKCLLVGPRPIIQS